MDLNTDPAIDDFRQEARAWLTENVPAEPRPVTAGPEVREYDERWQRRQYEGGWAGIDWEPKYGGRGLSLLQQVIWYEESLRAGAPGYGVFMIAFAHAGPTLIMRGSEDQKKFYLPRILKGETPWCQGFSEPGSGSDLASLSCRGVVDGDEIVISGSKIWTSFAQWCDYGEMLVRTDPDAPKHKGLTWLIMDMHLPGVDPRPIVGLDGFPDFCQVFYDDVRVPLANVVDKVNNGWSVAMATLSAERGLGFATRRLNEIVLVEELLEYARDRGMLKDQALADRLAHARALGAAVRSTIYYQVSNASGDEKSAAESTAGHTFYVQFRKMVSRLAIDILGAEALSWNPWSEHWLSTFAESIAGGTIDIQKNIIAERVLGLPR